MAATVPTAVTNVAATVANSLRINLAPLRQDRPSRPAFHGRTGSPDRNPGLNSADRLPPSCSLAWQPRPPHGSLVSQPDDLGAAARLDHRGPPSPARAPQPARSLKCGCRTSMADDGCRMCGSAELKQLTRTGIVVGAGRHHQSGHAATGDAAGARALRAVTVGALTGMWTEQGHNSSRSKEASERYRAAGRDPPEPGIRRS
jgi:hypothetical protein